MRERVFRKPTVKKLLEMEGILVQDRIDKDFILSLFDLGVLRQISSYEEGVEVVESLGDSPRTFALFPTSFRVPRQESDYELKSLDGLMKIDSQPVLRYVAKGRPISTRLTKGFLEEGLVWPYTLAKTATGFWDSPTPPIGFYWIGTDDCVRATTWMRAIAGAEMKVMQRQGDFQGEVVDRKPYGRNLRVRVNSRTEEEKVYEFTLSRLPMHKRGDIHQFSDWVNIGHNSSDPDASYRGQEHDKREHPVIVWSAPAIFAFYNAMAFVKEHPEWRQFRINPFPIPTDREMVDYVDNLRLRSLILVRNKKGKLGLGVLNKREMDRMVGVRTKLRSYDSCWHHWGKRDLSYLYKPK